VPVRVPANARTGVARGNGDQAGAGGASPGDTTARPEPPPIFSGRAPAGRPAGSEQAAVPDGTLQRVTYSLAKLELN